MDDRVPSILDMLGPIMIGPSSSHTAGVARIAFAARRIFSAHPDWARLSFYGSLARTFRGHGSDKAAVGGLLGIRQDDERLAFSFELARREGLDVEIVPIFDGPARYHPNTLVVELRGEGRRLRLRGASVGGGEIRLQSINGFHTDLDGSLDAILVLHLDEVGVIAKVSRVLADFGYNIAQISSHRRDKGDEALLVAEVDGSVSVSLLEALRAIPAARDVVHIPSIRS